jgi:hypothetical protein
MPVLTRSSAALCGALLVTACSSAEAPPGVGSGNPAPPVGLSAAVLTSPVEAGAAAEVRFVNNSTTTLTFNPCVRSLERRADAAWVPLPDDLRVCTAEVHYLRAGTEERRTTDVPTDIAPGEYRFRFPMVGESAAVGNLDVVTSAFTVR